MAVTNEKKTRIAVLGCGPSVVSALYWLTSTRALRERYDITVYQMGWRIGGKGASGRGKHGRIEEHGLHLLFGFYQNFFYMMRQAFAELDRPPGHPMRTWRQAFHPSGIGVEEEFVMGAWDPWMIPFPGNSGVPGTNGALLTIRQYIMMSIQFAVMLLFGWRAAYKLTEWLYPRGSDWELAADPPVGGESPWTTRLLVDALLAAARGLTHVILFIQEHVHFLVWLYHAVRSVVWPFVHVLSKLTRRTHRVWLDVDVALAFITGVLSDGLLLRGFAAVDDLDYREWLRGHGLHPDSESTTLVRTVYDAAFSYEDGDPNNQQIAAGTTIRVLLRWFTTYKGAAYYRMQAGMGDTVFAPFYEILKARGVKFEFFHKVESLHLSDDKSRIAKVSVNRQVELAEGVEEYHPLFDVKCLECWPAQPLYEQIKDPDRVRGIDLESYYSGHIGEMIELRDGEDFDQVLFGIPIQAVQFLCEELVANDETPRWRAMVDNVKAVETVAAQVWLTETCQGLGWPSPEPLLSLFVEPLNTWADMSHLTKVEDWPKECWPKNVSYFCGAQRGDPQPPPLHHRDAPDEQTRKAFEALAQFMKGDAHNPRRDPAVGGFSTLLPDGMDPRDPPAFDCTLFVDPAGGLGEERLLAQFWRSNYGPSERCTLSLPGTNKYRMKAGETGYENLFLTGDWTDNNLYLAFMEGSFQAGILSARAICGVQFPIIGEWMNEM